MSSEPDALLQAARATRRDDQNALELAYNERDEARQQANEINEGYQQAKRRAEAAERKLARVREKVKRLQGEMIHSEHCKADETHMLDGSACGACLTLEDFGLTDVDLDSATPAPPEPASGEPSSLADFDVDAPLVAPPWDVFLERNTTTPTNQDPRAREDAE